LVRISRSLSVILHPILLPTLATLLFFIVSPIHYEHPKIYFLVGLVFLMSYVLPLSLLIFFKQIKLISDFNISEARERKTPILSFMIISLLLGSFIYKIPDFKILSLLFFGCLFALSMAYLLLLINFKTSLHLIGISGFTAFFILLGLYFNTNNLNFIALLIFLNGALATARLVLKAHSPLEIIIGIILGIGGIALSVLIFL